MVRSSICQLLEEVLFRSVSYLKKYLFGSVNYLKQYFFWKSNFPLTRFSPSVGWTFCHNFQKGGKLLFHAPISANTVTANLYYITIHHQDISSKCFNNQVTHVLHHITLPRARIAAHIHLTPHTNWQMKKERKLYYPMTTLNMYSVHQRPLVQMRHKSFCWIRKHYINKNSQSEIAIWKSRLGHNEKV